MREPTPPPFSVVLWRDLFVLVVNNEGKPEDYDRAASAVLQRSASYPMGVGCLTIIPRNASPPDDPTRRGINAALERMDKELRCLCWLVEGDGFQGAMVRAILTGIRMFGKQSYPTQVSSSLQQALAWILPHLAGGTHRLSDVPLAARVIMTERLVGGIVESD
jgi:hypothetical protein